MSIDLLEDDSTSGAARELMDQPGPQNLVVSDWAARSTQGTQRVRNEDSWGQLGPIFAVADGMGGMEAGDLASRVAIRSLISQWFDGSDRDLRPMVERVNDQVRRALDDASAGGTTLSALRIARDQATFVHVGDSRIYRFRDDRLELLTRDQNLRNELMAAGIPPKASQKLGPLRALTSYLGMQTPELRIDVRSVPLRAGDVLVLCTDGVLAGGSSRVLEVVRTRSRAGADPTALGLTDGTRPDDATAVVVRIGTTDRVLRSHQSGAYPAPDPQNLRR